VPYHRVERLISPSSSKAAGQWRICEQIGDPGDQQRACRARRGKELLRRAQSATKAFVDETQKTPYVAATCGQAPYRAFAVLDMSSGRFSGIGSPWHASLYLWWNLQAPAAAGNSFNVRRPLLLTDCLS